MKKQNDMILISLVMIIILLIVLVSISMNLILRENVIIQKIRQSQEKTIEQINSEETKNTNRNNR